MYRPQLKYPTALPTPLRINNGPNLEAFLVILLHDI